MNDREQAWADLIEGMRNRACFFHNDNDADGRNRSWYARRFYGDKYDAVRKSHRDEVFDELDTESLK